MVVINLSIASINCDGLKDRVKRRHLFDFLKDSLFTIILLQETHFEPSDHEALVREWKQGPFYLNSVFGGKCGTAVLFNSHLIKIIDQLSDSDGRIIALDVDLEGRRFHVINTYFPNQSSDRSSFIHGFFFIYLFIY